MCPDVRSWGQILHNVVVVDDCSGDDTGAKALEVGATQTGVRHALSRGAGYIVTFDADDQHRPEDIRVLLVGV
jgi:glycosyltransferase involved in cell wall biosynthesis